MTAYTEQRFNMVASQVLASGVTDERILAAMGKIAREQFVPAAKRPIAYAGMPIDVVARRYLLDPRNFAMLLAAAQIGPNDRVLDVGCTTGYSTAVLAQLCGRAVGLEQDADLVRIATETLRSLSIGNAIIVQGAMADGLRSEAPFNVILINGAIEAEPRALLAQLADGGRLVASVGPEAQAKATVFLNERGRIGRRVVFDAPMPALAGFRQPVGFVF